MKEHINHIEQYFHAYDDYFWKWADAGTVIEWQAGGTLCYRDELVLLAGKITDVNTPPFGALLLLVFASRGQKHPGGYQTLLTTAHHFGDDGLSGQWSSVAGLLKMIGELPEALRTGEHRVLLLNELMAEAPLRASPLSLNVLLAELGSGSADHSIFNQSGTITREVLGSDISFLHSIAVRFRNSGELELKLRTGIKAVPVPVVIPTPELTTHSLVQQLLNEPATKGIGKLVNVLMSMLRLPLHSHGIGDQPLGGIADITNRGSYDKLLLSELAQDEMMLTARLVNNEALYYRREQPPHKPRWRRRVLLDTTLKMWGQPRILALSAAIAFTQSKNWDATDVFALGGEQYVILNLLNKNGVVAALEQLDHGLHCGVSIKKLLSAQLSGAHEEYILITSRQILSTPAFQASIASVKDQLHYVLTVTREGVLELFSCGNGHLKSLYSMKPDLEELLFAEQQKAVVKFTSPATVDSESPAFLKCRQAPLLFPNIRIKHRNDRLFMLENFGVVVISEMQRVLLITQSSKGAFELLVNIEKGNYIFGWDDLECLSILVNNRQRRLTKLYVFNLHEITNIQVNTVSIPEEIEVVTDAVFSGDRLYIRTDYTSYVINCPNGFIISRGAFNDHPEVFNQNPDPAIQVKTTERMHFTQHQSMFNVRDIYISNDGNLILGNYQLRLHHNNHQIRVAELREKKSGFKHSKEITSYLRLLPNKSIKFRRRAWDDGSTATIDGRGLLHLKSSDIGLPEVTIILVTGLPTACWASDGKVSGSGDFIYGGHADIIHCDDFYQLYIQPFIDKIIKS